MTREAPLQELDVVALVADAPEHGLVRGQVGTVVLSHPADVFDVEFVDADGATYAQATLPREQLMVLHYRPGAAA